MSGNDWNQVAEELRENLVAIERRANSVSVQLTGVCRTWESLKLDILEAKLEEERHHATMAQGSRVLQRDQLKGAMTLGLGVAGAIIGGISDKSFDSALSTGLGAAHSAMKAAGKSRWAVSLDRRMLVVPRDQITAERFWVTWESLTEAMGRLREKALDGKKLGNLAAIVSELRQDRQVRRCIRLLQPDRGIPQSDAE
jgi:hypothetical protein